MSVESKLNDLRTKIEGMADSETKREMLARTNKHLVKYDGKDVVVSLSEIEKEVRNKPLPVPIPSGITGLDELLGYEGKKAGGFYRKNHYILSAPPKSGKTAMMMELVTRMPHNEPMIIPLEQPAIELVETMVERGMKVPKAFAPYTNKIPDLKWVEDRITEAVIKYNSDIVFIDHLAYLEADEKNYNHNEHLKIRKLMHGLKWIAAELDIVIVTLVHINKHNPVEIPTTQALQGSSSIFQEASGIIMLWRETYMDSKEAKTTNKTLCMVQANRRTGQTGSIRLKMDNFRFIEDKDITFHHEDNGGYGDYDS